MTTSDVLKAAFSNNEYTSEEKDKLVKFRSNLAGLSLTKDQLDDSYLIKWLRARNLDLVKAEDMFRTSMKWRKDNQIDTLLEREGNVPEELQRLIPLAFCGISKEGYATFLVPFGRHDVRGMLDKYGLETCKKFNMLFMEQWVKIMKEEGAKKGVQCTQIIEICDCEGYANIYLNLNSRQNCRQIKILNRAIYKF